jgi:N-acetylated-alpha-linked acidic dipeptidase
VLVVLFWICCTVSAVEIADKYLDIPNPSRIYEHLAYYTSLPHVAGTAEDYETAHYTLQKLKEYGLEAWIEEEEVLLNYPNTKGSLSIVDPPDMRFTASMEEPYIKEDWSSKDSRIVPPFNGYAPSGNVTAELVYLNYGREEDFKSITAMGVDLSNKIALVRYGKIFRGLKVKFAQEHGMIGVIIYSDPADDGFTKGTVFPEGPWRNAVAVQRGSVQFLSLCPGDPRREKECQLKTNQMIPSIPVQPISWLDALPLLQGLQGTAAPAQWQGALNITYHIGPGPAVVNLATNLRFNVTKIWNVFGKVPADPQSADKDQVVLLGNHRDAWVFGAVDPNSGSSVMLEVARSYGELLKTGWKPRRDIIFCSWDGEEYALLGSTAFVERHSNDLLTKAVAYFNVDSAVTGKSLSCGSTPSLQKEIIAAVAKINDVDGSPFFGGSNTWNGDCHVLGSGSDYTAFLDHLGVASADLSLQGPYGVYHSAYDSLYWMTHFGDPYFHNHLALSKLFGYLGLVYADKEILPMNYTNSAEHMMNYWTQTLSVIERSHANQTYDYSGITSAIDGFMAAATQISQSQATQQDGGQNTALNEKLLATERQFIGPGLPKRPWYKHVLQAPGLRLGYGSTVLPGVYQTVEDGDWNEVQNQLDIAAQQIRLAAQFLLGSAPPKAPQSAPVAPPTPQKPPASTPLSNSPSPAVVAPSGAENPDLPTWAIAFLVIVGVTVVGGLIYAVVRYQRSKKGFMVVTE